MKLLIAFLFLSFTVNAQVPVGGIFSVGGTAAPVNIPPVANAGTDITITLPVNIAGLVGSGTDADGYIAAYSWRQIPSSVFTISFPFNAVTSVGTFTVAGTSQFELTVTDNVGATAKDTVKVIVNSAANIPPIAFAGPPQTITAPTSSITFAGSGTDADGTIVSYLWTKISGPSTYTITTPSSATSTVTNLVQGVYQFQLTVTDNNGSQAISAMTVTVNPAVGSNDGAFTYTITGTNKHTSAGVYKNDSILIKTLWNDSVIQAGTYTGYWNGTDDAGLPIISPSATYKVKVLSSNVQYTWQGTVGNTSDSMTGARKYRGYTSFNGLAFSGTTGYYCLGYSEGFSSLGKFNTSSPNTRTAFFGNESITGDIKTVCTDGTNVYWGVNDSYSNNNSFVFATKVSDDTETSFASGATYAVTYGKTYSSVISKSNSLNSQITGLTVSANYLFVARGALSQLQVLNKTTGALLQTLTFSNVRGLCVDGADRLWVLYGTNTIQRYTINAGGTLTSISTLSGPIAAISISYGNGLIAVCDGSTSQQVKFYNYTTSVLSTTVGAAGGYQSSPSVADNIFMFSNARATYPSFVAWQSDNSYWINDLGNSRTQHFNSSNTFVNRIMFLSPGYSTWVDKNNINRVFAGYLEFAIDYSVQTLTGTTGWSLVKNWGNNVPATYNDQDRIMFPVTLSNGRTYAQMNAPAGNIELIELTSTGIRFTGILWPTVTNRSTILCTDGSKQESYDNGVIDVLTRYPLTGFNGSNNPTWGAAEVIATGTYNFTTGSPVIGPRTEVLTATNKVVMFNYKLYSNNNGPVISSGYHLGIMQRGATDNFIWETEKSTHQNYAGAYPPAGWFDVGNTVSDFAGGNVNIADSLILTSYHGEFWKQSQTNKYNLYYLNGLAIGQFGITRPQCTTPSFAEMAGNALTPVFVKVGDSAYLYHGDESDHSGVHRWKISGLNTIGIQSITINYPNAYVQPSVNYIDLMAKLPFDQPLLNNIAGWTRNPTVDVNATDIWTPFLSKQTYNYFTGNDIGTTFAHSVGITKTISRDLGSNNVTTDWKITGQFAYPENNVNLLNQTVIMYIEVLDATGKTLTSQYMYGDNTNTYLKGNTATITSQAGFKIDDFNNLQNFEVAVTGSSNVTFTVAGFTPITTSISDGTGNWRTPKTLVIRFVAPPFVSGSPRYSNSISVKNLKLYKDY